MPNHKRPVGDAPFDNPPRKRDNARERDSPMPHPPPVTDDSPPPPPPPTPKWQRSKNASIAFLLGALLSVVLGRLGLAFGLEHAILVFGVVAIPIGLIRRLRPLLWIATGLAVALYLVVSYSPLVPHLVRGLRRPADDPAATAPAVVVLGSFVYKDQTLSAAAQQRIVEGYRVLGEKRAPLLVLTSTLPGAPSWEALVTRQMTSLGIRDPVEVVGPVRNTHDEALAVANLARQRGWDRVILVTHPWHMRRAAEAFESAGLHVVCSPCAEGRYDLNTLATPGDRVSAFRDWLHEAVGNQVYRHRGWIK